jgi:hypothetical protein
MSGLRYDRFKAHFGQVAFPNPVTGVNPTPNGAIFNQINGMVSWRSASSTSRCPTAASMSTAARPFNPSAEALSLSPGASPPASRGEPNRRNRQQMGIPRRRIVGERRAVPHRAIERARARSEQLAVQHSRRHGCRQGWRIDRDRESDAAVEALPATPTPTARSPNRRPRTHQ